MTGHIEDYPDYAPAWSRGWSDGPDWECVTEEFPVIVPELEKASLRARWRLRITELMGF